MKSEAEEIVIALERIERAIEQASENNKDQLEDISIALNDIARSQETIAKAMVLISGILDSRL